MTVAPYDWQQTHRQAVDQRLLARAEQLTVQFDDARCELRTALRDDDVATAAAAMLRLMSVGILAGMASRDHARDSA